MRCKRNIQRKQKSIYQSTISPSGNTDSVKYPNEHSVQHNETD